MLARAIRALRRSSLRLTEGSISSASNLRGIVALALDARVGECSNGALAGVEENA
jgi:hypothetical protein